MLTSANKQQGMTLLEVIISLVLAGGMMALAVPSVADWIDVSRIKATADSMLNGLQLAKMEAVRHNARARFYLTDNPTFDPATGGQGGDWEICNAQYSGSFVGGQGQVWLATENGTPVKIGVSTDLLAAQDYATPLAAGSGLTGYAAVCAGTTAADTNANVTFDAMGRASNISVTSNVTRIDILNSRPNNNDKRLVIIINPQGQIKLCNPASQDPNQRCG
ncbi:MAG: GspH/FimT family pseudopilin [Gallionella sp.]|nr:GspH/FimT family pseudopilin [Gallionella sp.]MDD4959952.1 GspH/FimT family pseudopilin [Gallionella sp.]